MTLDKILKILTIIVSLLVVETIITFINDLSINRQANFKVTRALKEQYTNAVNYCGNNKFANRGPYIDCMNEYIEHNAPKEYQKYQKIKEFCNEKEISICNIDNCVNEIILGVN